jgi:uncharacterized protein (TIGR02453 family)
MMRTTLLTTTDPALPTESFLFLQDLERNNRTEWFADQRKRYDSDLVAPLRRFIADLAPTLTRLNAELDLTYRINTTVMRINRDRRFQPGADPYRCYVKVSFPVQGRKWSEDPVYGFGIFPDYFYVAFRNAGKSRASFIARFERNIQRHSELFAHWLTHCRVSDHLSMLGGQHEAIEAIATPSNRVEDWLKYDGLTVGKIWKFNPHTAFPGQVLDILVRVYFLKLFALSDSVESDAERYFALVEELCN